MPYNFAADSFHTTNFAAHFLRAQSIFLDGNDKIVAFQAPLGGLGALEAVHLRLIGKLLLSSY